MEIESTPIEVREIRDPEPRSLPHKAGAAAMSLAIGATKFGWRTTTDLARRAAESAPGQAVTHFAGGAVERVTESEGFDAGEGLGKAVSGVVNVVVEIVDPADLLERIDLNRILATIDINALLERIDLKRILDGLDLNEILAGIDVDALLKRVDVAGIAQRARIGDLVAESTSQMATGALDHSRRHAVALDTLLARGVDRVLGRDPDGMPKGPAQLVNGERG